MRTLSLRLLVATLSLAGQAAGALNEDGNQLWAVELLTTDEAVARSVAADLGLAVTGRVFNNVFLMRGGGGGGQNNALPKSVKEGLIHRLIVWSERQIGRRRSSGGRKTEPVRVDTNQVGESGDGDDANFMRLASRYARDVGGLDRTPPKSPWDLLATKDPLRWRQWYLEPGGGMHLNVTGLWEAGIKGGGVSVAVLDDGVELTHLDLALNYDPAASWDLLDADPDPTPVPWSRHGTQLAGIIAAAHHNGLCGMGVAPWSGVGAIRMLGYVVWDATEAAALAYEREHVDVYVAAWGPVDTGTVMEGPGVLASRALAEGIALGRGGRGSIYIWASGNGGFVGDDCNADGYSNSPYTLTVSGSTRAGHAPDYAETCAATFVSTYSGDADKEYDPEEEEEEQVNGIVTTDTGGVCTESFRGSSVSAAMVAGVCALAIDMNPELTWRDMQHLMVRAAAPHNPLPSQWSTNGVGTRYSHYFGFGSLDAGKMVELARGWRQVPPAFRCRLHAALHDLPLESGVPLVLPLSTCGCQVVQVEHVQVNASVSVRSRGQVELVLESPLGTKSTLLPRRPLDLSPYGIHNHPMLTVHMWGEDPRGTWRLHVTYHGDGVLQNFGGKRFVNITNTFHNWTLIIHGTEVPVDRAEPQHYHYNASQLALLRRDAGYNMTLPTDVTRLEISKEEAEEAVRLETQHWSSPIMPGGKVLSYLFCLVHAAVPSAVRSVMWYKSDGAAVDNVLRRLTGRRPQTARYPSLLLVREVTTPDGNFTCRVNHRGEELHRTIKVTGGHSSVPELAEKTQVSLEGGTALLPCPGLAPVLRATWVFEGRQLRSGGRVAVGERQLVIRDVREADFGEYRCQVRSDRLHYNYTTLVTLLPARGPTTLTTHYTLAAHPPPIPQRVTPCNQSSLQQDGEDGATSAPIVEPKIVCPPPFETMEGHCVLVAPGEARSWHQARSQCQGFEGDLLVIENAALLLAMMRLFHTQGLTKTSFWVGGEQHSDGWRWVNGAPLEPGSPLWYPSPSGGPKKVPPPRPQRRPPPSRRSTEPRSSSKSRSRRPNKRRKGSSWSLPSTVRQRGTRSLSPRQAATGRPHASDVAPERPWPSMQPDSERRGVQHLLLMSHQEEATEGRGGQFRSSETKEREAPDRRRAGVGVDLSKGESHGAGRQEQQQQHDAPRSPPRQVPSQKPYRRAGRVSDATPVAAPPRHRAACLWARLRHFLVSCWAEARLRALCQYRPGAAPPREHSPS